MIVASASACVRHGCPRRLCARRRLSLLSMSALRNLGVSENKGVPYLGVLIIRILLFRVL